MSKLNTNKNLCQKLNIILEKICHNNLNDFTYLFYSQVDLEKKAKIMVDKIKANTIDEAKILLFENRKRVLRRWIKGKILVLHNLKMIFQIMK